MSRVYTLAFSGTITAAQTDIDLVSIAPAADIPVRIISWEVGQSSELGDAQEEGIGLDIKLVPATVTDGSGGATATPTRVDQNDAAAGATARLMDTTVATTSGSLLTIDARAWNLRGSPIEKVYPDPQMRPRAKNGQRLILRWTTTVADDVTVNGSVIFEEI